MALEPNSKLATGVALVTAIAGLLSSIHQLASLRSHQTEADNLLASVVNAHSAQISALEKHIEELHGRVTWAEEWANEAKLEAQAISEFAHDTRLACDEDYANRYGDKSDIGWRKTEAKQLKLLAPMVLPTEPVLKVQGLLSEFTYAKALAESVDAKADAGTDGGAESADAGTDAGTEVKFYPARSDRDTDGVVDAQVQMPVIPSLKELREAAANGKVWTPAGFIEGEKP